MPRRNHPTAAEARRRREDLRSRRQPTDTRRTTVSAAVSAYRPGPAVADVWPTIRPSVIDVLASAPVTGTESVRKHITHLAHYYAWAINQGLPPIAQSLTRTNVETYISTGMTASSRKSRADRRARLRPLADLLHPEQAPQTGSVISRPAVKPPYTRSEMAAIRQAVLLMPEGTPRARLSLCVGLGAGAGLGSADFRALRRRHLDDRGSHGLVVTVPGARPRTVPVRETYESLVRVSLVDLADDELLLGGTEQRKNLAARTVEEAGLLDSCPHIEQSRLRHTWLADMLGAAVPLNVILSAAGLRTARTLTDVAELLPPPSSSAYATLRRPVMQP